MIRCVRWSCTGCEKSLCLSWHTRHTGRRTEQQQLPQTLEPVGCCYNLACGYTTTATSNLIFRSGCVRWLCRRCERPSVLSWHAAHIHQAAAAAAAAVAVGLHLSRQQRLRRVATACCSSLRTVWRRMLVVVPRLGFFALCSTRCIAVESFSTGGRQPTTTGYRCKTSTCSRWRQLRITLHHQLTGDSTRAICADFGECIRYELDSVTKDSSMPVVLAYVSQVGYFPRTVPKRKARRYGDISLDDVVYSGVSLWSRVQSDRCEPNRNELNGQCVRFVQSAQLH